jgi:hypothetical protein
VRFRQFCATAEREVARARSGEGREREVEGGAEGQQVGFVAQRHSNKS